MASSSLTANDMERIPGKISSLYEQGEIIGKGLCGIVYEGTRRSDGQEVAIKHIISDLSNQFMKIPGHDKPLLTEVAINLLLNKPVKCPNIVEMFDWFVEDDKPILVMEYPHPCETLYKFLKNHEEPLKETEARHLMRQAVNAAKHSIDHNITHGDLHSCNVLINTKTMELKLIDFGFSRLIPDTPCKERTKGVAQMVSSLGGLLLMMTTGLRVTKSDDKVELDTLSIEALGLSKECLDFIRQCRFPEAPKRPTLEELLDHEWFKQG